MYEIINIFIAILSVLIIPTIILVVKIIIDIKLLKNDVVSLDKFDKKIDEKLDKIYDLLIDK